MTGRAGLSASAPGMRWAAGDHWEAPKTPKADLAGRHISPSAAWCEAIRSCSPAERRRRMKSEPCRAILRSEDFVLAHKRKRLCRLMLAGFQARIGKTGRHVGRFAQIA